MGERSSTDPIDCPERCNRRLRCWYCAKAGRPHVHATVRIFSGSYGGGFPACDVHEISAATDALEPLARVATDSNYTVTAYTVDARDGTLWMRERKWTATKKVPHGQ